MTKCNVSSRLTACLIAIALGLTLSKEVLAQGSITNLTFYSNSLDTTRNIQVYLPEGYNPQDSIRYPVIYFLHGANGDHNNWTPEMAGVLDSLIGNLFISPTIIVKPDGSVPWSFIHPSDGSWYTNSELYGDYEDYIVFDLVEFIDAAYKTISIRGKRAIWGASMGGYGAMMLALKHPDMFCAVASQSGPLDFNHWTDLVPAVLSENGGPPVLNYVPTPIGTHLFTYFFYNLSGAFSPNLNNTPYPVDFPLDSMGNFIDSTFNKWLLHDPARLASNITPASDLAIYFDCGRQDEFLLYPFNEGFRDSLNLLGLDYIFQSFQGGHSDQEVNRFPISLSFLDSVMNMTEPVGIFDENDERLSSFMLYQNYPNPFNPSTSIAFALPKSGFVTLKIYNTLGEEVATLVSEKLPAGKHQRVWEAKGLASGVYVYRLEAGEFVQKRKLVLLR
jgi:S-formylglutathione hydrolase FrmB